MKQRIVLLGPPASGKGTQADRLSASFGIPHVSTGALLRSECSRGTALGKEADEWTRQGLLVPDELAIRIITSWMAEHGTSFLFDGFPRSVPQTEHLDRALNDLKVPLDLILVLELDEVEVRRRIEARLSCLACGATFSTLLDKAEEGGGCPRCGAPLVRRRDDLRDAVEKRLQVYREITHPVIAYYEKAAPQLLCRVDARGGSDAVFSKIVSCVDGN